MRDDGGEAADADKRDDDGEDPAEGELWDEAEEQATLIEPANAAWPIRYGRRHKL